MIQDPGGSPHFIETPLPKSTMFHGAQISISRAPISPVPTVRYFQYTHFPRPKKRSPKNPEKFSKVLKENFRELLGPLAAGWLPVPKGKQRNDVKRSEGSNLELGKRERDFRLEIIADNFGNSGNGKFIFGFEEGKFSLRTSRTR